MTSKELGEDIGGEAGMSDCLCGALVDWRADLDDADHPHPVVGRALVPVDALYDERDHRFDAERNRDRFGPGGEHSGNRLRVVARLCRHEANAVARGDVQHVRLERVVLYHDHMLRRRGGVPGHKDRCGADHPPNYSTHSFLHTAHRL